MNLTQANLSKLPVSSHLSISRLNHLSQRIPETSSASAAHCQNQILCYGHFLQSAFRACDSKQRTFPVSFKRSVLIFSIDSGLTKTCSLPVVEKIIMFSSIRSGIVSSFATFLQVREDKGHGRQSQSTVCGDKRLMWLDSGLWLLKRL